MSVFRGIRIESGGTSTFVPSKVDDVGLTVTALSGQTGDLFKVENSSNTALIKITSAGNFSINGDNRIDLSSATTAATNTDGGVIKAGTSSAPVTEDTADMKFVTLYWDNGATSGDNRGIY